MRCSRSGQCYDGVVDVVGVGDIGRDASLSVVCDDNMNGVSGLTWVSSVAHPPCIPMYTTRSRMRASSSDLWEVSVCGWKGIDVKQLGGTAGTRLKPVNHTS